MATQAGLANELYTSNANITHEAFVAEFLKVFPAQTAKIAALYWQNRPRRASFGLAAIALPEIYKDSTSAKEPKPTKAVKATVKRMAKEAFAKKGLADSSEAIAKIKEANLARLKEVSAKLKPKGKVRDFGTRVAKAEGEGVADFDPTLAREEINSILRDERLIDVCPKFVREDI
jgi:hypothetical protein